MSSAGVKRWPGESDAAHPEVFNTLPPQPPHSKPGQLTQQQLRQLFEEGFVMVKDFFKPEELEPVKDGANSIVDTVAQKLHRGGKISSLYEEYDFYHRVIQMEKEFPGAVTLMLKSGILPQAIRDLWSSERLLNAAEQILGTEDITGHPVWNLRPKVPRHEQTTVPWHQDVGYLDTDSYSVLQLAAWIPLVNTTVENGCMQMMRKGHKTGRVAKHTCCHGNTWYVTLEEAEMKKTLGIDLEKDCVNCPVPYGSVLFFNNLVPHRSLKNTSDSVRWTLDLRWQRSDKPVGFYGLKDGIRLRSSTDADFKPDWQAFAAVDRNTEQFAAVKVTDADFDTTVVAPWMKQWEIVHSNVHTDAMLRMEAAK